MKDFFENKCEIVTDLLPLFADHCCSEKTALLVRAHLDRCPGCRAYLNGIKTTPKNVYIPEEHGIPDSSPDYAKLITKLRHKKTVKTVVLSALLATSVIINISYLLGND